jgi:hypothetical protein
MAANAPFMVEKAYHEHQAASRWVDTKGPGKVVLLAMNSHSVVHEVLYEYVDYLQVDSTICAVSECRWHAQHEGALSISAGMRINSGQASCSGESTNLPSRQ